MNIDVPNVCGEDLISRDSGKKIRDLILSNWNSNKIVLDFKDKLIGSVSFFDEAIALLIKKGNKHLDEIHSKLHFLNLRQEDRYLLNYVFSTRVKESENKK